MVWGCVRVLIIEGKKRSSHNLDQRFVLKRLVATLNTETILSLQRYPLVGPELSLCFPGI
jgi:hypothetical protein